MPDLHQTLQESESEDLGALVELALDLRNCWNHSTHPLWSKIEPELWALTHNPWSFCKPALGPDLSRSAAIRNFRSRLKSAWKNSATPSTVLHGFSMLIVTRH